MIRSLSIALLVALAWAAMLPGCGTASRHVVPIHNDTAGERVVLRMLTYEDWETVGPNKSGKPAVLRIPPQPKAGPLFGTDGGDALRGFDFAASEAAGLLASAVGFGIDLIKQEIDKEIKRHKRQFSGLAYENDFWEVYPSQPRYAGFELVRYTDRYPEPGESPATGYATSSKPAFHLICAFEYNASDPRVCVIKPVYFITRGAKAKVSKLPTEKRKIDSKIDILLTGAWIGEKGNFAQSELATAAFSVDSYELAKSAAGARAYAATFDTDDEWQKIDDDALGIKTPDSFLNATFGFFLAPPASLDRIDEVGKVLSNWARAQKDLRFSKLELETLRARKAQGDARATDGKIEAKETSVSSNTSRVALEKDVLVETLRLSGDPAKIGVEDEKRNNYVYKQELYDEEIRRALGGGAFKLSVTVTETDRSKVKDGLLFISNELGEHKTEVTDAVRKALGGDSE